jgi:addiction module HigA family antidote
MTQKTPNRVPNPGEVLFEEFLKPRAITAADLSQAIGVSAQHINEIVHGQRSITCNIAFRLSNYFGTSSEFWMRLQDDYEEDLLWDKRFQRLQEAFAAEAERRRKVLERLDDLERRIKRIERRLDLREEAP